MTGVRVVHDPRPANEIARRGAILDVHNCVLKAKNPLPDDREPDASPGHTGRAIQKLVQCTSNGSYSRNAEFRVSDYGDRQPLSVHRLGHSNVSANAGVGIPRTL